MAEFEERADQLSLEKIDETLADGYIFKHARSKLLAKGAKFLVGPRGTGKTHVMRYTYLHAMKTPSAPLALYANFSRYLNLEPLLKKSPDALQRFHSWVLAKLLLSCFDLLHDTGSVVDVLSSQGSAYDEIKIKELVSLLERGSGNEMYETYGQNLTVNHVLHAIATLSKSFGRARAIVLLDDAALSLAEPYLIAFFEIYRLLKTETVSPKASVYPGSTQYGPTFHASHETQDIHLWLSVEDADYSTIMGEIAVRRLENLDTINPDVLELLKYVAFGVPRAYLKLVRDYLEEQGSSVQQKLNKVINRQTELMGAEYDSLAIKLKQFNSVIQAGRRLFDNAVLDIKVIQSTDTTHRNLMLGIKQDQHRHPLAERMLRFLVEVGMLYPLGPVSHGPDRKYDRFFPHFAFLQQQGVFRSGTGSSPKDITTYLSRPAAKHPLRRDLATLLGEDELSSLKLDLPPCGNCQTARINDSQRFCHACGAELVASSLFEDCMKLELESIPEISAAMIARLHNDTKIRTIGHVYASQSVLDDLQQATYVGPARAKEIVRKVSVTVAEFLS